MSRLIAPHNRERRFRKLLISEKCSGTEASVQLEYKLDMINDVVQNANLITPILCPKVSRRPISTLLQNDSFKSNVTYMALISSSPFCWFLYHRLLLYLPLLSFSFCSYLLDAP